MRHLNQARMSIQHTFVSRLFLYYTCICITCTHSHSLCHAQSSHTCARIHGNPADIYMHTPQYSTHLYCTCIRITHTFVSHTLLKYKHTHTLSLALSQTQYHDITERDRECVCTILLHMCLYRTSYRSDRIKMSTISIFVFISEREATACKFKGKKLIPYHVNRIFVLIPKNTRFDFHKQGTDERWGAGVEYHFQEFNEPYALS